MRIKQMFGSMFVAAVTLCAADLSVSVVPSGGNGAPLCTDRRSDGNTAVCAGSTSADRYGSAQSSYYSRGVDSNSYTWVGCVHASVQTDPVGLIANASLDLSNEFQNVTGTVVVTNTCVSDDCEAVILSNGDTQVTLKPGESAQIVFAGSAIQPKLFASHTVSPTDTHRDYVGLINVTIKATTN
jgi:hypothetical protein